MRITEPLVNQFISNRNAAAKQAVYQTTEKVINGKKFESIADSLIGRSESSAWTTPWPIWIDSSPPKRWWKVI